MRIRHSKLARRFDTLSIYPQNIKRIIYYFLSRPGITVAQLADSRAQSIYGAICFPLPLPFPTLLRRAPKASRLTASRRGVWTVGVAASSLYFPPPSHTASLPSPPHASPAWKTSRRGARQSASDMILVFSNLIMYYVMAILCCILFNC